jgi:hypothetical protein
MQEASRIDTEGLRQIKACQLHVPAIGIIGYKAIVVGICLASISLKARADGRILEYLFQDKEKSFFC